MIDVLMLLTRWFHRKHVKPEGVRVIIEFPTYKAAFTACMEYERDKRENNDLMEPIGILARPDAELELMGYKLIFTHREENPQPIFAYRSKI